MQRYTPGPCSVYGDLHILNDLICSQHHMHTCMYVLTSNSSYSAKETANVCVIFVLGQVSNFQTCLVRSNFLVLS